MLNVIQFSVVKYIPMTVISIVYNMCPIISIVFAFLLLKEKIKTFEVIMVIFLIGGVVTVVTGADGDDEKADESTVLKYGVWGALFLAPFLQAAGLIIMRSMKKFNVNVVSWYCYWGILVTSLILVLALGEGF